MIIVNSRFLTQKITGVQRNAIEISRELRKLYPDITFISPQNIYHRNIASELNVILFGRLRGHLWEQIDLHRYLNKNNKPLLLNMANTAPISYKNQIVTICDLSFLRHPEWFSKTFYFYYRFLIPKIVKNSLKIVTISKFSKNEIMDL